VRSVHSKRRQAAVRRRVPAVRGERHARRRFDYRRGADGRGKGRVTRLVRRVHTEGAVSHRGQENDGGRARGTEGLAVARLDHLSDWWWHRHGRNVESVRRARTDRVGGATEAAADGDGAG